ncbi:hypothetical protein PQE66_gp064 [Bacillus phage PBC2]|uniref:Uncharacterized protein n=1 Tax=Bacillus phage PBC2 TaxID=1675029 RepID=A0A218KBV2_9CAUD|nr:hypothetical protein PQE66_gp064 [Bacillus phage PBC2]AKQ08379.1 hypothetical protein PBC2_064 [Bacillus phage PBC2]
MEKISVKCHVAKNDELVVDYGNGYFGIDLYQGGNERGGILINHENAEKMYEFLKKHLGK